MWVGGMRKAEQEIGMAQQRMLAEHGMTGYHYSLSIDRFNYFREKRIHFVSLKVYY
jgi:hypothetical protein